MTKVVLDTNVLVSALWSNDGNPHEVVKSIFKNEIVPYYNDDIIEEYQEVLSRTKLNFPDDKVQSLMQEIKNNGIKASSVPSKITFADESDRKFYDLAKTNEALLITGNLKHYPSESFIMNPNDFLHQFRSV
jgi:putative PIN family toxin of toxin-antitoxin system